jgi:hypothetical protein
MLLILLIVLVVFSFGGALYHEPFRGPGIGLGTILLIVLIVMLMR